MEKISSEEANIREPQGFEIAGLSSTAFDPMTQTLYLIRNGQIETFDVPEDTNSIKLPENLLESTNEKKINENQVFLTNEKTENCRKYQVPETMRFCKAHSSEEISISGLTATCRSKDIDKISHFYSNMSFKAGIHYWEIICPISCSGIEFGVVNKVTNDYISAAFRTTTPRVVSMKIDFESMSLSFWLNQRLKRTQSIINGDYQLLIKMKNYGNKVILNPFCTQKQKDKCFAAKYLLCESEKNLTNQNNNSLVEKLENKELGEETKTTTSEPIIEFTDFMNTISNTIAKLNTMKESCSSAYSPNLKCTYLKFTDKLLIASQSRLKLITRCPPGFCIYCCFDPVPLNKIRLQLDLKDAVFLLRYSNWVEIFTRCREDQRRQILEFIQQMSIANSHKEGDKMTLSFIACQAKMHEVISAILGTILLYNLSNSLDNIQKTPSIQTVSSSEVISDNSHCSVQPPSSFLSSIDLLRLGSILLDLQEQCWVASNADGRLADSNLPPSAVSRLHTSYGRLASFVCYPESHLSPLELSEAGLVNTQDAVACLRHFQSDGTQLDEDIFGPAKHEKGWLQAALADTFANGQSGVRGFNVPLHRTTNCFPPVAHSVLKHDEPGRCIETCFTHICSSPNSEFLVSANSEDGSVCIWNSAVRLFVAGRLNLKQIRASNLPRFLQDNKSLSEMIDIQPRQRANAKIQNNQVDISILAQPYRCQCNLSRQTQQIVISSPEPLHQVNSNVNESNISLLEAKKVESEMLHDLVNMGFSEEESKMALISTKNVSVELALDAIFANRASQTASKENTQVHIDPQVSESDKKVQIDANSKEESKEELKEELKEYNNIEIHQESIQNSEYSEMADKVSIHSIGLLASIGPSDMPLVLCSLQSISNSYYLDLLSIKYNNQYLSSLIENNGTYQNVKIDSYKIEKSNESESKEEYWPESIKYLLAHYRLSVNTLIPLFLGDQSKSASSSAQCQTSPDILTSGSSHQISLDMFTQVFGSCTARDYSEEQNGAVCVYGAIESQFSGVIVEFTSDFSSVIVKEHFSFDFPIPVKEFSMEIQGKRYIIQTTEISECPAKCLVYEKEDNASTTTLLHLFDGDQAFI